MGITWSIIGLIIFLPFAIGAAKLAPFLPMRRRDYTRVLDLGGVQAGTKFADLGCGNGGLTLAAAQRGAEATGVEINIWLWIYCQVQNLLKPKEKRARFILKDATRINYAPFDVVFVFWMTNTLSNKWLEKFASELKPDAKVISYVFAFPGLTPTQTHKPNPDEDLSVYVYSAEAFRTAI